MSLTAGSKCGPSMWVGRGVLLACAPTDVPAEQTQGHTGHCRLLQGWVLSLPHASGPFCLTPTWEASLRTRALKPDQASPPARLWAAGSYKEATGTSSDWSGACRRSELLEPGRGSCVLTGLLGPFLLTDEKPLLPGSHRSPQGRGSPQTLFPWLPRLRTTQWAEPRRAAGCSRTVTVFLDLYEVGLAGHQQGVSQLQGP